jgi:RNA polymerase sigma-70 factor (family 1)
MDESELQNQVKKLRKSDPIAFKSIVQHFHSGIFRFLFFRINDRDEAEDLLQETFVRLWENRHKLDENLSLSAFLFTTASNLSLNHIRHQKVVLQFRNQATFQAIVAETPYHQMEYEELQKVINEAIEKMGDKVRMVFLRCKVDGIAYKVAAEQLDISVATVESHMVKALRIVREALEKYNR